VTSDGKWNSKFEAQNPKQTQSTKVQNSKQRKEQRARKSLFLIGPAVVVGNAKLVILAELFNADDGIVHFSES